MTRLTHHRRRIAGGLFLLAAGLVVTAGRPTHLRAQIAKFPPPEGATTHTVVPGARYRNAGFARWFLGGGYRDIWVMPVDVPVLDLDTMRGGLTVVETGGFGQSFTLEFLGADGLQYAVRSLDKDPTRRLAPELQGTVVSAILQDQIAGFLPTAGLVTDGLFEVTGLLYASHELVVVPDDPRLGEFREDYAGLVGLFVDRPQEGPDNTPGFAGSRQVSNTRNFLRRLEEGACNRVDAREYLKARLMDMLVGDRDRHPGQWTWARFPEADDCFLWRPIPEDRDQAFIRNDGFLMSLYRLAIPQQVKFGPNYPSLLGLTWNGWELDRQLLVELDEPLWAEVAEEIRLELTDDVIERAVRRLPQGHYDLIGEFLIASLESRRDQLLPEALAYFRMISRSAEIKATDRDELLVFEHHENGNLTVTIQYLEGPRSDRPYFERTFRPSVTDEVRVFLQGGDDQTRVIGTSAAIRVRSIGGGGDDRFENASAAGTGRTRFYDDRGDNTFDGPASVDERPFDRPPSTNLVHRYALDWGTFRRIFPELGYSPDLGLQIGFLGQIDTHGFRKVPWASRHELFARISTIGPEIDANWTSRFRESVGPADLLLRASTSGGNSQRFYGFGNDTQLDDQDIVGGDFYKVQQRRIVLAPALEWSWGRWGTRTRDDELEEEERRPEFRPEVRAGVGPVLKFADAPLDKNEDRFIGTLDPAPLGVGAFGQLGAEAWFEVDTRDKVGYPARGFRFQSTVNLWAPVWDAEESFGKVQAAVSGFLTPGNSPRAPTLALRIGGENLWGAFPFYESAFIGGAHNVRGIKRQRYAGDASLYGNAEIRLPISRFMLLFPTEFGVHGVADVGRVFFEGDPDSANSWHTGFGGGVWLAIFNRTRTISATLVRGDDKLGFYLQTGFAF
ncbi:MAG: hypothetical protein ACC682_07870 [Gemmatimonadota bacterium]